MKKLILLILLLLPAGVQADEMEVLSRVFPAVDHADLLALRARLAKRDIKEQKKIIVVFARAHKRSPRDVLRELNNPPRMVVRGQYWARYNRTVEGPWVHSLGYLYSELEHLHRLHRIRR